MVSSFLRLIRRATPNTWIPGSTLVRVMSGQEGNVASETWDAMVPHFLKNMSPAGHATLYQQLSAHLYKI